MLKFFCVIFLLTEQRSLTFLFNVPLKHINTIWTLSLTLRLDKTDITNNTEVVFWLQNLHIVKYQKCHGFIYIGKPLLLRV